MNPSLDLGRPSALRSRGDNGSVVIVAMTLAVALAMLAGGYISLTSQSMRQTQRTFHLNTAFNLAESGAEYAVWCLKNDWTLPTNAWTGDAATKTYTGNVNSPIFTDAQGNKAYFNLRVTAADTPTPTVVSEGIVVPATGAPVSKQIRVRLSNGGLFANGLVAKDRLTLNGGEIDSYRSSLGDPVASPRGYEITVASTAIEIGDITLGSAADIYGSVAIGASDQSGFISTIQGQIIGPDTSPSDDGVLNRGGNLIDTNRIAYDYTQDFPDVTVPPAEAGTIIETSLPLANAQGLIIVGDDTGNTTIRYQLASVSIPNGKTLMVVGPVEFDVATTFSVAGNAALVVVNGTTTVSTKSGSVWTEIDYPGVGTAKLYVGGNVSISGNGSINAPYKPSALQVYGTLSEAAYAAGARQSITVGGNGDLTGAIYAPNADLVMNGGGTSGYIAGAAVGRSVRVNGTGYRFRYDKDLEDLAVLKNYRVTGWAELINPSDRQSLAVTSVVEQPVSEEPVSEEPPSTGTGVEEPVTG
jgi:Tfp pilus assembly protein PilX